jgi:transcriptional regulator with XRE-family HTH domain
MKERKLKQVDIIRKCQPYCKQYNIKLTKNYLSQYVSGKVEPSQRRLSILSMALEVNEAWLMGFDVPMERESMPQSDESPVLKAIYNSDIMKKLSDRIELEPEDINLLMEFKKLNASGKQEAIKRVSELTYFPKYNELFNEI